MKVKIKRVPKITEDEPDPVMPHYAKDGDAGLDLTAVRHAKIDGNDVYFTGLSIEIPKGFMGLIFPRSSIGGKAQTLVNSVGVIDSGYRGEIILKFKPTLFYDVEGEKIWDEVNTPRYKVGERVGQLIILPYPQIEFVEGDLSESERGEGGFGSTNK